MLFILYLIYIINIYTSTKWSYRWNDPFPFMFSKIKHDETNTSVLNLNSEKGDIVLCRDDNYFTLYSSVHLVYMFKDNDSTRQCLYIYLRKTIRTKKWNYEKWEIEEQICQVMLTHWTALFYCGVNRMHVSFINWGQE